MRCFYKANLSDCDFTGSVIRESVASNTDCTRANFRNALVDGSNFNYSNFKDALLINGVSFSRIYGLRLYSYEHDFFRLL